LAVVPGFLAFQAPNEGTMGRCGGSGHDRSLTGLGPESGRISASVHGCALRIRTSASLSHARSFTTAQA
jgi:hypothetical protein